MTMVCLGSLLTGKTARLPMLIPAVGPKSVSGTQVGPLGEVVRKFDVFQIPPEAPPTKTVLPDGSEGSTAIPPTRPAAVLPLIEAGPTGVHVLLASTLAGLVVKIR